MRRVFEEPIVEIVSINAEDIIATSTICSDPDEVSGGCCELE